MIGWAIGLAGVALMYAAVYPSIKASAADLNAYVEKLPDAFKSLIGGEDYTSPAGYLRSEFFSPMGPLLLLIFAIGAGRARDRRRGGEPHPRPAAVDAGASARGAAGQGRGDRRGRALVLGVAAFAAVGGLRPAVRPVAAGRGPGAACLMLVLAGAAPSVRSRWRSARRPGAACWRTRSPAASRWWRSS